MLTVDSAATIFGLSKIEKVIEQMRHSPLSRTDSAPVI